MLIGRGTAAAEKGYRVNYTLATQLVNELVEAADEKMLAKTVARYGRDSYRLAHTLAAQNCQESCDGQAVTSAEVWRAFAALSREVIAGEGGPAGQAMTVVISGASVTGTATCSFHCQAPLEAGITSSVLPRATSCASWDWV